MSIEDYSDSELEQEIKDRGILPLELYCDQEILDEVEHRGISSEIDLMNFETETLICHLNDRHEEYKYDDEELTDIYYALRDGKLDKVIEKMNPLLYDTIGRKV